MIRILATGAAALTLMSACANGQVGAPDLTPPQGEMQTEDTAFPSMLRLTGAVNGADGTAIGTWNMLDGPNGILFQVTIEQGGLTPGWHGLHLHQVGDCSDTGTFKLSGGHVGMLKDGHGLLNPEGPEGGDLPNIWAAADGSAGYEAFITLTDMQTLADSDGSALIIHANRDDHLSQPIGGAGGRVACAVIR